MGSGTHDSPPGHFKSAHVNICYLPTVHYPTLQGLERSVTGNSISDRSAVIALRPSISKLHHPVDTLLHILLLFDQAEVIFGP
jgi:hypothetical protein